MLLHFAKKSEKHGDTMFSVADSHSTMQTITSNHRVTYVTAGIIKSIWHISTTYTQTYLDTNIRGIDSNECLCMLPCENVNVIQMSSNNDDLRSLAKVHPLRYTTQHTAHIRAVGELALSSVSMCGISAASSDVLSRSLCVSLARWKSTETAVNVRYFILVAC